MSKVNRAVFQTVVEENKRLKADIKSLVEKDANYTATHLHWKLKFQEERDFKELLHLYTKLYIKEHPEEFPEHLIKKVNDKQV